jgi:hypothetical protein
MTCKLDEQTARFGRQGGEKREEMGCLREEKGSYLDLYSKDRHVDE